MICLNEILAPVLLSNRAKLDVDLSCSFFAFSFHVLITGVPPFSRPLPLRTHPGKSKDEMKTDSSSDRRFP